MTSHLPQSGVWRSSPPLPCLKNIWTGISAMVDSRCGSASLCPWGQAVYPLWWISLTKVM